MSLLFLAIQQYLLSVLTHANVGIDVTYIRMWMTQADKISKGEFEDFPKPAIFIEFVNPLQINQLGNGNRIYEPLKIRVHTIYEWYDSQDGSMGQNLPALDFVDKVYFYLQDWMPSTMTINNIVYHIPVGAMQITSDTQDNKPNQIYHHIQEYITTWVDEVKNRPVGGFVSGILNYELDNVLVWNDTSLYTVNVYVSYIDGNIYQCIQNTTSAHELPTDTAFFTFIRQI